MKRATAFVLLTGAALALALALGLALSPPVACQGDDCLPGTGPTPPPPTPPGPPRCFLPLVIRSEGGTPPPPTCEGAEREPNDTHTDATPFVFSCARGTAEWDGDSDWYRVHLCSGPFTLSAALDGPDGVAAPTIRLRILKGSNDLSQRRHSTHVAAPTIRLRILKGRNINHIGRRTGRLQRPRSD